MTLRARRIVLAAAVLAMAVGAAILLPLLWRDEVSWPGALPIDAAASSHSLPHGWVLEPCRPEDKLWEDDGGAREAFQSAQPLVPRLEASVHPSWGGAPWKVQLYDRDDGTFIGIVGFTPEDWSAGIEHPPTSHRRDMPAARVIEFPVSADTASQLESEWHRSIGAALVHGAAGADGTTFFFRAGNTCARTWSPPEGSRNAQLTHLLGSLAESPDEATLRASLAQISPPPRTIPWPPIPEQAD